MECFWKDTCTSAFIFSKLVDTRSSLNKFFFIMFLRILCFIALFETLEFKNAFLGHVFAIAKFMLIIVAEDALMIIFFAIKNVEMLHFLFSHPPPTFIIEPKNMCKFHKISGLYEEGHDQDEIARLFNIPFAAVRRSSRWRIFSYPPGSSRYGKRWRTDPHSL